MKRFGMIFCAFLLLGAGCAGSAPTTLQIPAPDAPGTPEIQVNETTPSTELNIAPGEPNGEQGQPDLPVKQYEMRAGNFFFDPISLTAETGQTVEITFTDVQGNHTFDIDEIGLHESIHEGSVVRFVAPEKGGEYSYYCSMGNHRAQGMEGIIHVKEL